MRPLFLPLILIAAAPALALTDPDLPPVPRGAFRADVALRSSPEVDAKTRALQQSLFKKPEFDVAEPKPQPAPEPPAPPPVALIPKLVPPPQSLPNGMRELAAQPTTFTPYDRYMGAVRSIIAGVDDRRASMGRACILMKEAHAFRYLPGDPYRAAMPSVTAATRRGDCKAKSLWLFNQLGDPEALYVIGKAVAGAKNSHAWVYWRNGGRWWILDPTNRSAPVAADSVSESRYVAYYSFGKAGAFRHKATRIFMAQDAANVNVVAARR